MTSKILENLWYEEQHPENMVSILSIENGRVSFIRRTKIFGEAEMSDDIENMDENEFNTQYKKVQ